MHQLVASSGTEMTLTVTVDPLRISRGHRALPRGAVHATPRTPSRSKGKHLLHKQFVREEVR